MRKRVLLLASMALAVLLACGVVIVEAVRRAQAAFPGTNGKVVFTDQRGAIKLINPDGSGLSTLLNLGTNSAMSPTGTGVAFAKQGEIYKVNIDNRKITRITSNYVYENNPTWSPDGKDERF